jgi:peptide deformylase
MPKKSLPLIAFSLLVFSQLSGQNFIPSEKSLILSGDTAKMMRVLVYNSPTDLMTLNTQSIDIDPADPLLPVLARRMYKAMRDTTNSGVGIAAPQVGINRNAMWVQRFDKSGTPFEFLINPRVLKYSMLHRKGGEGCLSMPGERGTLYRSYSILVEYQKMDGSKHKEMFEDNTAIIFQHEIDHLNGYMFPDRMREQQGTFFMPMPQGVEFFIKLSSNP